MSAPERIPPGRVNASDPSFPAAETTRALLTGGTLTVHGRIEEASNAVLYGVVAHQDFDVPCVYKPVAGERPLWDFPDGNLAQREVAAYEISRATGWDLIPATVLRDGPYGEGMCQVWVGEPPDATAEPEPGGPVAGLGAEGPASGTGSAEPEEDGEQPLLALVEGDAPGEGWKAIGYADVGGGRSALLVHADDQRLRRLAVLDAVINNGDRKGGHLLPRPGGLLYAIDHGVTFHVGDKLRTLLWGWAGEELTAEATEVLRGLSAALAEGAPLAVRLSGLLTAAEVDAVRKRTRSMLSSGRHPLPSGDWPAIPWPPV
ncbi:SCO1664 family protein [Streptomyces iconiensis]|uniref:SCO1664 family protein n=1 Tax=Streptomyces iconiensis TaxID=1384038 RepID=A0ABT7A4T3_9ACTN|nr:SCO1664 family protein [Streptomyces iconiensis]MDJ1136369.1 SCO1664 family protein [Streptomyces iconiensis]